MKIIDVASGRKKADLILRNVKHVNVRSGDIEETDIVIANGKIAALGRGYNGLEEFDATGLYAAPGFIEGHIHIESSMMTPPYFAKAVLKHGTTSVIADPHEIANVSGIDGVRFMIERSRNLPIDIFFMAPSCVPATPLETSGAKLNANDLKKLKNLERVIGLAEMMNFPGVYRNDPDVVKKLGIFEIQDGHAPLLRGKYLNAYISGGIYSDHECTEFDEALEKLKLGMHIMIREGTLAKNLRTLLPLIKPENWPFFSFVSDDRHPSTILNEGHLDSIVRKSLQLGLDLVTAIRLVTINTARYFRLFDRGEIAPGKKADIVLFDKDINVNHVIKDGHWVVKFGEIQSQFAVSGSKIVGNMNVNPDLKSLRIPAKGNRVRVIQVIENSLITGEFISSARVRNGEVVSDVERDILKISVWERHKGTGNVGLGFVNGFGLREGAIASTVAHDSHNIIAIGVTDSDTVFAVHRLKEIGGGMVVVKDGEVMAELPLPVGGLMADLDVDLLSKLEKNLNKAYRALGGTLANPFMQLSFLALPVIPELKITDFGLVRDFKIVDLFV